MLAGLNRLAGTLEVAASVTPGVLGDTSAGSTPTAEATGVIVPVGTAAAFPVGLTRTTATTSSVAPTASATARTQPAAPGPNVTATPVAPTPAVPTGVAPTLPATPTVAPPTVAQPTVASLTAVPPPTVTPPGRYEDLGDFEAFLELHRSSIADQPFEILSLTVDTSDAAMPYFVLAVEGNESADVFAAQTAADTLDYGRLLLGDIVRYIGGGSCTMVVNSIYQTASADACAAAAPWCQVGPKDESSGTWPVDWIYVRASYESGVSSVEAWNAP